MFKRKGLSLCFVLDLRIPGENCSNFHCHISRAAPGISFLRIPTMGNEYTTNWRNKIVAVITRDRVIDGNLKRHTCDQHYPQEKMITPK